MRHQQKENDQDHIQLSYTERRFIELCRQSDIAVPTMQEIRDYREQQKEEADQLDNIIDFLQDHREQIAGALHVLMHQVLISDDFMHDPDHRYAYTTLYDFKDLLHAPPKMYE